MAVLSVAQVWLVLMVAGINLFGIEIGSNPFALLRNEMADPVFLRPDYLSFIKDGNDLNPLLQNYWMVIHPSVLFLGFAAAIIPFAYAIAALWTRQFSEWVLPVLPWTLFAAATLGSGIGMGAMWAYESLTFGGYWTWDPVENASLVPWLMIIAAIHTMLIHKRTGYSLRATFLFTILSFILVLFSTYLTRSGILGDTSVHAFTAKGMSLQVVLFFMTFAIPGILLFIIRYKKIPTIVKEEGISSREWWMFMGALVLFIAAGIIICMTSLPVLNKVAQFFPGSDSSVFKPLAIGEDAEYSYNRIQIVVSIIIGGLTGMAQFLNYRQTPGGLIMKRFVFPAIISLAIGILLIVSGKVNYLAKGVAFQGGLWLAIISNIYAVIANSYYIIAKGKRNLKLAGSVLSHAGFGLMMIGILVSASGRETISQNRTGMISPLTEDGNEKPGENLTLFKDVKTGMGDYWVTYLGDSANPRKPLWYYKVKFDSKDGKESFTLNPNAFVNYKGIEGIMSNPAAMHYWDHDIFAYITSIPDPSLNRDSTPFETKLLMVGDTLHFNRSLLILQKTEIKKNIPSDAFRPEDTVFIATVALIDSAGGSHVSNPILITRQHQKIYLNDSVAAEGLVLQLDGVHGDYVRLNIKHIMPALKYVTLKVYQFPFINLLWMGIVTMILGLVISILLRIRRSASQERVNHTGPGHRKEY